MKAYDVVFADPGLAALLINAALPQGFNSLVLQERGTAGLELRVWEFRESDLNKLQTRWPNVLKAILKVGVTEVRVKNCQANGELMSVQKASDTNALGRYPSCVWVSSEDLLATLRTEEIDRHTTWAQHGGNLEVSVCPKDTSNPVPVKPPTLSPNFPSLFHPKPSQPVVTPPDLKITLSQVQLSRTPNYTSRANPALTYSSNVSSNPTPLHSNVQDTHDTSADSDISHLEAAAPEVDIEALRQHLTTCFRSVPPEVAKGPDCYVYGKLVVADNAPKSQVRDSVMRDQAPLFGNRVIWKGMTSLPGDLDNPRSFCASFPPGLTIWEERTTGDRQLQVFTFPNGRCHWSLSVPWKSSPDCLDHMRPEASTPPVAGPDDQPAEPMCQHTQRMERCLQAASVFGVDANLLIRRTSPETVQEHPLLLRESTFSGHNLLDGPSSSHGNQSPCPDNVVLLMDAAMPDLNAHSGIVTLVSPLLQEVMLTLNAMSQPSGEMTPRVHVRTKLETALAGVRGKRTDLAANFLHQLYGGTRHRVTKAPPPAVRENPVDTIIKRFRKGPGRMPPTAAIAQPKVLRMF